LPAASATVGDSPVAAGAGGGGVVTATLLRLLDDLPSLWTLAGTSTGSESLRCVTEPTPSPLTIGVSCASLVVASSSEAKLKSNELTFRGMEDNNQVQHNLRRLMKRMNDCAD
jgi:hypothetical protein